jgi:hypothetical protein
MSCRRTTRAGRNLAWALDVSRPMTSHRRRLLELHLLAVAALWLGLAACSGAAAPSAATPSPVAPTPIATPPSDAGAGGGSTGNIGTGGAVITDPTPLDPAAGQPTIVLPKPGQKNPHPVGATTLQASVDGRHVLVKVSWYSGVEPCYVLDSVKVERSGTEIAITLVEGASRLDVACIEIAQLKATIVDLGDLEPGTYTIGSPSGDAQPIQITIN